MISALEEEIEAGRLREVYAIRLAYVGYRKDKENSRVYLCPTWYVEGQYFDNPKEETPALGIEENASFRSIYGRSTAYGFKGLVVNAQTAEFKSPDHAQEREFYCPEIITWKDMP